MKTLKVMTDKNLEKLNNELKATYDQQKEIEEKIKKRKIEIAKENNQIVNSIEDLTCEEHPESIFKIINTIPGSYDYSKKTKLNIYQCGLCEIDKKSTSNSKAYDCSDCGIVVGEVESRHYRSSKESWQSLAGREGEHYHCTICETQIGSYYWMKS